MKIKFYFVHLCYYPDYFEKSIKYINEVASFFPGSEVYVVDNGGMPRGYQGPAIEGDNSYWEFSGWEKGRAFLRDKKSLKDDDVVIFSNDTVNHHRYMTWFDGLILRFKVSRIAGSARPFLIGEKLSLEEPTKIFDCSLDAWVSTYFFAANGYLLNYLESLCIEKTLAEKTVVISAPEGKVVFSDQVSIFLSQRIARWLYPDEGDHGWYKAKAGNVAPDIMKKKAIAILNEKYLSAVCFDMNGVVEGMYEHRLAKKYRRWAKRKYKKIINS